MSSTIFQNEKTPFQPIKTRSLKSRKIVIILKSLTHGFCRKMAIFPTSFCQAKQIRKISFTIFQNEKTSFQDIKTRSSKIRKIDIFPKGLTHRFGPKMAIFETFFFRQYRPGKCNLRYLRTKNGFLGNKNKKFKKSKNWCFCTGVNPSFLDNNGLCCNFFFFKQNRPGKCLLRYSKTKKPLSRLSKKTFKKSKNWHYS